MSKDYPVPGDIIHRPDVESLVVVTMSWYEKAKKALENTCGCTFEPFQMILVDSMETMIHSVCKKPIIIGVKRPC